MTAAVQRVISHCFSTTFCVPWAAALFFPSPGVDYEAILRQAEREADVVVWDGGNNDTVGGGGGRGVMHGGGAAVAGLAVPAR